MWLWQIGVEGFNQGLQIQGWPLLVKMASWSEWVYLKDEFLVS